MKSDVKKRYTLIVNSEFIVPNGKTEIVPGEFYGIKSMISVRIPDSVISIGKKSILQLRVSDKRAYTGWRNIYRV